MKKKRKKSTATLLPLHSLGSAPDVPSSVTKTFAHCLFGSKKSLVDFQEKIFEIEVTENVVRKWDTVIVDKKMFVFIPADLSVVGSKESFVSLLEIAEEDLECSTVICCIHNNITERSAHLRTFMYMGFQAIERGNANLSEVADETDQFFFLGYEL